MPAPWLQEATVAAPSTGAWSLLPPLVAIGLALWTRQIVVSLLAGIFVGWWILAGGDPLRGAVDTVSCLVDVFSDAGRVQILLFTLLIGALLLLVQRTGGIRGFVERVERWAWARSRRGAQMMACVVGLGIFIESIITVLVVGTVARPLFDRLRISREKLAYLCDSTSAPVCILLPINGWGATVLGLLAAEAARGNLGEHGPLTVFLTAVPLNFYALLAVLIAFVVAWTGWDIGPMRAAERRAREEGKVLRDGARPVVDSDVVQATPLPAAGPRLANMLVPLLVLVLTVPVAIFLTGRAGLHATGTTTQLDNLAGWLQLLDHASGSAAVFYGVVLGLLTAMLLALCQRLYTLDGLVQDAMRGMGGLIPMAVIMLLAFAIGMTCEAVGTGRWVATTVKPLLTAAWIAPLVFAVSGLIAFATGTSWGTFAIMIPLAAPLAAAFAGGPDPVSIPLVIAAVLGGAVFGDHCSPISDTTVISSMAACSDHIDHVRTQLPYALLVAAGAFVLFYLVG
ncbi:MAG: Na+/H+ antiporter NhaC family protein [Planctomycetota bacterium]|jgi:Na+/H+ antiporter NhaC